MSTIDYKVKTAYQRGIQWLIAATLLSGVSIGGVWVYYRFQNQPPASVTARLQNVQLGNIENKINEGGTVELGGQRTIKSPADGAVDQVLVKLGDRIRSGQQLISLRNPERETILSKQQLEIQRQELVVERNRQKVIEAQTKLQLAQEKLQNDLQLAQQEITSKETTQALTIQELQLKVERQKQKVIEAQEELIAAEDQLKKNNNLLERGFIAEQDLDAQKSNVRQKQASVRDAELELKNSQFELERKKVELIIPENPVESQVLNAKIEVQQAQSEFQQTLSELDKLKVEYQEQALKLQDNLVISPLDGIVLNINVQPGDGVNRSNDLITLGNPNQELVRLQLSTLNAAQIKPNQPARISIIGPNAKPFTGRVKQVNIQATTGSNQDTSNSSESSSQATVPAIVQLDQPTGALIPGSPVSVEIILEGRNNVIVVNTELIQREEKSTFVWKLDAENKAQKQPVTLGLEGLTQVEVKSGLKVGDRVVIPPPDSTIEVGTPIVIETEEKGSETNKKPD